MQTDKLEAAASQDGKSIQGTAIGYAINLVMDYGSGRQATISGTLPLGASKQEMDAELDKLRLVTNRQAALIITREVEMTVLMASKTKAAIELMIAEYDKGVQEEIDRIGKEPNANHTTRKAQVESFRAQASNFKQTKRQELLQAEADIAKGEAVLAKYKKEIEGD